MTSKTKLLAVSAVLCSFLPGVALAFDGYTPNLKNEFVGWCAGQSYSAQVCKCAVGQAAVQIPAVAMATFLASAEGAGTANVSTGVGLTAVQIITTCSATSSGSGTGDAMNALGGMFGK